MEFDLLGLRVFIEIPYGGLLVLALLLIGLSIAYWFMMNLRKKRVIKFGNFETLRRVEGYKRFSISPIIFVIRALVVIMLFLVATESIQVNMLKPVANANVIIAMDVSSTMLMPDYEPNRLEAAKESSLALLSDLPEATKVGIVSFSSQAQLVLKPTNDVFRAQDAIRNIQATPEAGTALSDALKLSASTLNQTRPIKESIVIVLTDGKNNVGSNLTDSVDELKRDKVRVYAVGIGNNNKTLEMYEQMLSAVNETSQEYSLFQFPKLDADSLEYLAKVTGGKFLKISDSKSLEQGLFDISTKNERIALNSEYYILLFITVFMILELVLFSKYGAI